VVFGLCLAAPSSLVAQDESDQSESSTSDDPMHFSLRLGVKGGLTVQGAEEVPETIDEYRANGMTYSYDDTNIFGSFGAGGGGGAVAEIRFGQVVGLETGFYVTADNAKGNNEVTEAGSGEEVGTAIQYQKTTAFHVPLLVKFALTKKDIRPVFGLGLEFVIQQDSSLSYENDDILRPEGSDQTLPSERNEIEPSNYTMFMFTGGVEFDVGPVTIPVELRVGYNLGWDNTFTERVRVENPGADDETFIYDGKYLGHAGIFTGVQYRWDFGGSSDTSE
jgi:hypothetical protein